jgi:hypothetical protein
VLWVFRQQEVVRVFSKGGARLPSSQIPSKEARAQEGEQVKPVGRVEKEEWLLKSFAKMTVAPGALEMELATTVFSSVEIFVGGQPNLISASLGKCRTILGNSRLRMLSKC